MTIQQIQAVQQVAAGIIEAAALDGGAPAGILYSALFGRLKFSQFQQIVRALVDAKFVTQSGVILRATENGKEWVAKLPKLTVNA